MTISVRLIEEQDNEEIHKIIQNILEKHDLDVPGTAYFDPQLNNLYAFYKDLPKGAYWVLTKEEKVIGGIGVGPFGDYEEVIELQKYYIKETHQGKGYGTLLYNTALDFVENLNVTHLYLETIDKLGAANEIYNHLGFQQLDKPLEGSEHGLMNRWFIKAL